MMAQERGRRKCGKPGARGLRLQHMPHKRKFRSFARDTQAPDCRCAVSQAHARCSVKAHEGRRDPWQAEWLLLPESLHADRRAMDKRRVELCTGSRSSGPMQGRANLGGHRGSSPPRPIMMALAPRVGRDASCARDGGRGMHARHRFRPLTSAPEPSRRSTVTANIAAPHEIESGRGPGPGYIGPVRP